MEAYYYNQLNKIEQSTYHAMLTGLQNLAPEFQVPLLDGQRLADIYFCLRLDHPELVVSLNWPQAGLRVSFKNEMPAQQMVVEEANEGEKE